MIVPGAKNLRPLAGSGVGRDCVFLPFVARLMA